MPAASSSLRDTRRTRPSSGLWSEKALRVPAALTNRRDTRMRSYYRPLVRLLHGNVFPPADKIRRSACRLGDIPIAVWSIGCHQYTLPPRLRALNAAVQPSLSSPACLNGGRVPMFGYDVVSFTRLPIGEGFTVASDPISPGVRPTIHFGCAIYATPLFVNRCRRW